MEQFGAGDPFLNLFELLRLSQSAIHHLLASIYRPIKMLIDVRLATVDLFHRIINIMVKLLQGLFCVTPCITDSLTQSDVAKPSNSIPVHSRIRSANECASLCYHLRV